MFELCLGYGLTYVSGNDSVLDITLSYQRKILDKAATLPRLGIESSTNMNTNMMFHKMPEAMQLFTCSVIFLSGGSTTAEGVSCCWRGITMSSVNRRFANSLVWNRRFGIEGNPFGIN